MGGGCIDTGCASRTLGRILGRGMESRKRGGFGAACAVVVFFLAGSPSTRASEPPDPGAQQPVEAAEWVRQGMTAVAEGREAEARARFQGLAAQYPLMADYAEYWLAQSLLREQRHEAAANVLARARGAHPESRLAFAFAVQEGDLKAALGDEEGARSAWRAASGSLPRGSSRRAPLWLAVADSFAREKDREAAHRAYRDTWSVYPLEPEGERAAEWLAADAANGGHGLSARDWHRRANRLYRLGADEQALEAYDEALKGELDAVGGREIRRAQADLLFRQRRYDKAAKAFAALPQRADVPVEKARSIARAGRVPEAIDLLVKIARRAPARKATHRARYIAALLMIGEERETEARELLEQVAETAGALRMKRGALWQLAWDDYRAGRYEEAISRFDPLIASHRFALDALRPRYWKARAQQRLGDPQAMESFERIAVEFPLSYYGWQSTQRLSEAGRDYAVAAPRASTDKPSRLEDDALERVRILIEAGRLDEAGKELEAASRRFRSRAPGDRLRVAGLFQVLGDYHRAQAESMRIGTEELARGPQRHREEFWWHAWPQAYMPDVRAAVAEQDGAVDPDLVLAIIREESSYRPAVVSAVGARGLMQLMKATAGEVAARRGETDFDADELFEPSVNIRLGTDYLAELGETFPESPAAAIASYNAGPHIVAKWPGRGELDEDEWIETIPYNQTEKYVKRVLRTRHAYDSLYDHD